MEQYSYHEETGKITLEKKTAQNSENTGKSIYLMSLDEFLSHPRKLVRKNNFIHSMTPIQYCKIEKYRECVQGTMRVPKGNKGQVCIHNFGFYLSEQRVTASGRSFWHCSRNCCRMRCCICRNRRNIWLVWRRNC